MSSSSSSSSARLWIGLTHHVNVAKAVSSIAASGLKKQLLDIPVEPVQLHEVRWSGFFLQLKHVRSAMDDDRKA